MGNIKVLIVEDEMLVAENLADCMRESGFNVCGIAISANECFELISSQQPDILILDICLKGKLDGIEIATILTQTKYIPFIFLTANTDPITVSKALPLKPGAFISKPFNNTDVQIAVELACQKHNDALIHANSASILPDSAIFLKDGLCYKRIEIASILYIEAKGSYSNVVTTTRSYTLSYNLNYFTSQIKSPVFKKVHRSFIVNINNIQAFDSNSLQINRTTIPVSKTYRKEVMDLFTKI